MAGEAKNIEKDWRIWGVRHIPPGPVWVSRNRDVRFAVIGYGAEIVWPPEGKSWVPDYWRPVTAPAPPCDLPNFEVTVKAHDR